MKTDAEIWALTERMQAEIAREIRVLLGEEQYDQRIFTEAETARRVEALQKCAALQTSDAERHESWMQMHIEQGWTYGAELDPANKRHPNLKPWDELPPSTRSKARIFDICARYAAAIVGGEHVGA
jgi:RyR domain